MVAAFLSTVLMLMVSGMWFSFGRVMSENVADAALTSDARLVFETIRRDFSGQLAGVKTGEKSLGRLVGRMIVGGDRLLLCYDGAPVNENADWSSPDSVVEYRLDNNQLLRIDAALGATVVIADGVTKFSATALRSGVRIELTIRRRAVERTYTLITRDPG
jgi:hypothetical protein